MKKLNTVLHMLSLVLVLAVSGAAIAQDTDALIALETQGGVTELLDEIRSRDDALLAKNNEIAELKAAAAEVESSVRKEMSEVKGTSIEEALAQRNEALKARDTALAQRDEALNVRDSAALETTARIRSLEDLLAPLQRDLPVKDARIAQLEVELTTALASTRKDRITLAYNLACIYKAGKLYTKAEAEFRKALDLNENDPGVHYNLGILYDDNLGHTKKALYHYQRFLDLAPNDKDAANVIEWISALH
jgi:tetratricopeptide (TPR) repeat protein